MPATFKDQTEMQNRDTETDSHSHSEPDAGLMRAVVQDTYGEAADVLRLERIERPAIGARDVLVQVEAAGVDRGVWHLMTGLPYPVRLAGYGMRAPKTRVRGLDLAGRVVAVGKSVTTLEPGDEVFGVGDGTFAEYAVARADKLVRKPAGLSFEEAAAIPISGLAALQGLRDQGKLEPGERVLVLGASGGVGGFAVQIAKSMGAEVTGVGSAAKVDLIRSLGADRAIAYDDGGLAEESGFDLILDAGGNTPLRELRRLLAPKGRLVIVGGEGGGKLLGGTDRQLRAMLLSPFVGQRLGTFISAEDGTDLAALKEMVDAGELTAAVDRSFPLERAAEAVDYMQAGRARGKVVLTTAV